MENPGAGWGVLSEDGAVIHRPRICVTCLRPVPGDRTACSNCSLSAKRCPICARPFLHGGAICRGCRESPCEGCSWSGISGRESVVVLAERRCETCLNSDEICCRCQKPYRRRLPAQRKRCWQCFLTESAKCNGSNCGWIHTLGKAGWADESRSTAARGEGSGETEVVTSTRAEPTVEESIFLDKLLSVTESPPTTTN